MNNNELKKLRRRLIDNVNRAIKAGATIHPNGCDVTKGDKGRVVFEKLGNTDTPQVCLLAALVYNKPNKHLIDGGYVAYSSAYGPAAASVLNMTVAQASALEHGFCGNDINAAPGCKHLVNLGKELRQKFYSG